MKFKSRFILIILLLLLPAVLIACGGDDDKDEDDGGNNDNDNQSSAVTLSETHSYTADGVTLTFNHPSGWVAADGEREVTLASSQATLDKSNDAAATLDDNETMMILSPMPAAAMGGSTSADFLGLMTSETGSSEETTVGEITDFTVGGNTGSKVSINDPSLNGMYYLFPVNENWFMMAIVASKDASGFESTASAIFDSINIEGTAP